MAKLTTTIVPIQTIITNYKNRGYVHQKLELNHYSLNNIEEIVSGCAIFIRLKSNKLQRLWCNKQNHTNINQNNLVYGWPNEHQWWMKNNNAFRTKIANVIRNKILPKKSKFNDFDDLYDELLKINITSGDLFRYDLTRRLAYCMKLQPSKYVYLHRGAEKGAMILHSKGLVKLPANYSKRVDLSVFAGLFPNMDSIDIENLLCIHKKDF